MEVYAKDLDTLVSEPEGEIQVEQFQGCCGVQEIFYLADFETDKEADALIEAALEEAGPVAMAVYTTNQDQKKVVAALERAGFQPVAKGKNNHSTITLWVKVITKVPTPRKRS